MIKLKRIITELIPSDTSNYNYSKRQDPHPPFVEDYPSCDKQMIIGMVTNLIGDEVLDLQVVRKFGGVLCIKFLSVENKELILPFILRNYGFYYKKKTSKLVENLQSAYPQYLQAEKLVDGLIYIVKKANDSTLTIQERVYYEQLLRWVVGSPTQASIEKNWVK